MYILLLRWVVRAGPAAAAVVAEKEGEGRHAKLEEDEDRGCSLSPASLEEEGGLGSAEEEEEEEEEERAEGRRGEDDGVFLCRNETGVNDVRILSLLQGG